MSDAHTDTCASDARPIQPARRAVVPDVVIGLAAAGSAMLFQALLHLAAPDVPFAPFSLVAFAVRHAPGGLATGAIELLGRWALRLAEMGAIMAALGAGIALRHRAPRTLALAAFLLTLVPALVDPTHPNILAALAAALVAGAAALTTALLLRERRPGGDAGVDVSRRRLLAAGMWGLGVALLGSAAVWRALHPLLSAAVTADLPLDVTTDRRLTPSRGLRR